MTAVGMYHWRHGWIPLTHAAAMSKAKGNRAAAVRYLNAHPDTAGGKKDFTPAETFRMPGPDLKQHAANGSKAARTELDRRAAKRASKAPSVPTSGPAATRPPTATRTAPQAAAQAAQAKSLTPAELHAQNRGGLNTGDEVALRVTGSSGLRIGTVQGFAADGRPQVHVPGHGTVTRSADGMSTTIPAATRAAEHKRQAGDWSKTPTATLQRALERNMMSPRQQDAMRQELDRRGEPHVAVPTPAAAAPGTSDAEQQRQQALNDRIAPAGYTVTTKTAESLTPGGPTKTLHVQRTTAGDRVGSVVEQPDGSFRAMYQGHFEGMFTDRKAAHAHLAQIHDGKVAEAKAAAAAKELAAAKAAVANAAKTRAVAAELARSGSSWQPHTFHSDGTRGGDAAAAKIKQSFKSGNHTVHIETAMSKENTKALLADISAVVAQANVHDRSVTFHVPSGDKQFRATRRGTVGGYVRQGQSTVFINPKVASGELSDTFGTSKNFMPGAANTTGRRYVITHELGHIIDHQDRHTTRDMSARTPSGMVLPGDQPASSLEIHRAHKGDLSTYGKTNAAEGYAEAYAQWVHGGPGSSKAADAYARRFGWTPPVTKPT